MEGRKLSLQSHQNYMAFCRSRFVWPNTIGQGRGIGRCFIYILRGYRALSGGTLQVWVSLSSWVHEDEGSRSRGQGSDGHEYDGMTTRIKKRLKFCRARQPWPEALASEGILELPMRTEVKKVPVSKVMGV